MLSEEGRHRSAALSDDPAWSGGGDAPAPGEDFGVDLMGLRLHDITEARIVDRVVDAARSRRKMLVVNANAHLVVLSQTRHWLRDMFQAADIAFCDGAGVQLAGRLLRVKIVNRATPPVWVVEAMRRLGSDAAVFWLGGTQQAVEQAAVAYEQRYGVRTVGVRNGYFDASPGSQDTLGLVEEINKARPSVLLVTMGMPRQEQWLWENWGKIQTGVAITAGALVDHASGAVERPKQWVSDIGLEWAVRLVREPRRLWRRYLIGLPVFGLYVLNHAIKRLHR